MCCCGKPTINGELGYKWNQPDGAPGVYPVDPPTLEDGDVLLYDEPGRCGGLDSHCYHFRLVQNGGALSLLVKHGGGEERVRFGWAKTMLAPLAALDSTGRYWIFQAAHHAIKDEARKAVCAESSTWRKAAAEKRIKTRKQPSRGIVKVWIEPAA